MTNNNCNDDCAVNSAKVQVQFFVKMMSGGKNIVLQANVGDTVEHVHSKLEMITGIPMAEQRLIYLGKQLQLEQTLDSSGVQNDSTLQLVGRMRSTSNLIAWQEISNVVTFIHEVCRGETFDSRRVKVELQEFMSMSLDNGYLDSNRIEYFNIFMETCVPQALIMLYKSRTDKMKRESGDECIRWLVKLAKKVGGTETASVAESGCCAMMVLDICKLLKVAGSGDEDVLYVHCRSVLGTMLDKVKVASRRMRDFDAVDREYRFISFDDVFSLLMEVGQKLLDDWVQRSAELGTVVGPSGQDVSDFSAFLRPVLSLIGRGEASKGKGKENVTDEFNRLYCLSTGLLTWVDQCMHKLESCLGNKKEKGAKFYQDGWSHYLGILKELSSIAVLFTDTEDWFWNTMRKNKVVVRALVLYHPRVDDHVWLLKLKDVLDFEFRRHLAMSMLPEVGEDHKNFEMLIDRSQLLEESFEYVSSAEPSNLQAGLFVEFKYEEAKGPGVLREWFCLVCQALFDPRNALFVACPLERQRFYPNPGKNFVASCSFFFYNFNPILLYDSDPLP